MIKYVAIGAVVGFVLAYFLISQSSRDPSSPAVEAPARVEAPVRAAPPSPLTIDERSRLQPLPPNTVQPRTRLALDGGKR